MPSRIRTTRPAVPPTNVARTDRPATNRTSNTPASSFDGTAPARGGATREDPVRAREPMPLTHPELFTADGQRKWKAAPEGVEVIPNDTGKGTWIEKWRSPKTGEWVHNYTAAEIERKAGAKFVANRQFGEKLPAIREAVAQDLRGDGDRKVMAAIVHLIDKTCIRVGNEDSAEDGSFGATTLTASHVKIRGDEITLDFVGKKHVPWHVELKDATLAKVLKELQREAGGPDKPLFHVGGKDVQADEVNRYLDTHGVTAKNFRTFHATRLAREILLEHKGAPAAEREEIVSRMFEAVAPKLGHTPGVCRQSYVDPAVVDAFMKGKLR